MSMSSLGDTPANHSAPLDDEKEQTTPDICGPISGTPFAEYDPDTHCWRTYPATSLWGSEMFSQTWPRSGTTHNGIVYQLKAWAHPIVETGCLLWPTPTSRDYKDGPAPRIRDGKIQTDTLGRAVGGSLNPMWVEWLMGFPFGWTDLNA